MGNYLDAADLDLGIKHSMSASQVESWIRKAETSLALKLRRRGCSLVTLAADETLAPAIRHVLQNAVIRVLRNPDGFTSESEDGYSYGRNPIDAAGNVWYPDDEISDLCPRARTLYGSIQLGLPEYRMPGPRQ